MNLKEFEHDDWVQIWEGHWSFLSCSHFGDQYTKEIRFGKKPFVSQAIIFSRNGRSTAWIRQSDRDLLGKYLASQENKKPGLGKVVSKDLREQVDKVLPFMQKYIKGKITLKLYREFWDKILEYYHPHINVKYVVDYLTNAQLKKLMPDFEGARVYAEDVFEISEDFVYKFAKDFAKDVKYPWKDVLALTKQEVYFFPKTRKLPSHKVLQQRFKQSALIFDEKGSQVFIGKDVGKIEQIVIEDKKVGVLKGASAFPGKVVAVARVINDPKLGNRLKKGEVLVSGMTRPEFLPIMKRASAFVTDSGGMLCHAAIVAREMKKPCVIGTQQATKVLKDGDLIEVDADRGEVRILKS